MWHSPPILKAKNPETDFDVYISMFRVNGFVSRIRQTKFTEISEMDFDVYIFMFRDIFFISSIRQTQFQKY